MLYPLVVKLIKQIQERLVMYDFGSRLQAIRIKRGLTQKMLARKVNKSTSAISSYESNAQMPPTDVLMSIATALNVSLGYLVGEDNENSYSANGLTEQQKAVLDMLFVEFSAPTNVEHVLSAQQITILQNLLLIFSENSF